MKKAIYFLTLLVMAGCLGGCDNDKEKTERKPSIIYPTDPAPVSEEIMNPVMDFFKGYNEKDPELLLDCQTPQVFVDAMKEQGIYESCVATKQESIDATLADWSEQYGDDVKIMFMKQLKNDPIAPEYLDMAETMMKMYYYEVKADLELVEGFEVAFDYVLEGSKDRHQSTDMCCFVKESRGDWFLILSDTKGLEIYADAPAISSDTEGNGNG